MSYYFLYTFRFRIREDAPASLKHALSEQAAGRKPDAARLSDLPTIVRDYLRGDFQDGQGVHLFRWLGPKHKYVDGAMVEMDFEAHEGSYEFFMTIQFHDDEHGNGGVYLPYWLFQYAADDGPIGTMQQTNGNDLPEVYSKNGDLLIKTELAYHPEKRWPSPHAKGPDRENPVVVKQNMTMSISEIIASMNEGFGGEWM